MVGGKEFCFHMFWGNVNSSPSKYSVQKHHARIRTGMESVRTLLVCISSFVSPVELIEFPVLACISSLDVTVRHREGLGLDGCQIGRWKLPCKCLIRWDSCEGTPP